MEFQHLNPMLEARDLDETIAFYRDVLGFRLQATWPLDPPRWCSLSYGGGELMFYVGETGAPAMTGLLYCYPDDVDVLYRRIADRAPEVLWGPEDREYGWHEFAIRDPNGYILCFGQRIEADDD